jgi:hypothetical protein
MEGNTAQALWQDYHFLTKEMLKFIGKQDMNIFYELLDQRGRMQALLEQIPNDDFKTSLAGQRLLSDIQQDNLTITRQLQTRFNRIKRSHHVSEIYNNPIGAPVCRKNWDV